MNVVRHRLRQRSDRDQDVDADVAGVRADLLVEPPLVRAELEHVAEHRDAAGPAGACGRGRGEIVEGGAHRHRVGVVAVIDQQDVVRELTPLTAAGAEDEVDVPARGDADRLRGRDGGEEVRAQMGLRERDLELDRLALRVDREPWSSVAAVSWTSPPGPKVTVRRSFLMCGSSSGSSAGMIAVPVCWERGDQLGLRRGDRLDRAEQLEVDRAEADDDADVRLGDLGELGDLAPSAHRHLEDEDLGAAWAR